MYYVMRASAPSLRRESTDSLIYIYIYISILALLYYYSSLLVSLFQAQRP